MGDCQNYGLFLGPYYSTGPNLGAPKRDHNFDNPAYIGDDVARLNYKWDDYVHRKGSFFRATVDSSSHGFLRDCTRSILYLMGALGWYATIHWLSIVTSMFVRTSGCRLQDMICLSVGFIPT